MKKIIFALLTIFILQPILAMEPSHQKRLKTEAMAEEKEDESLNLALIEAASQGDCSSIEQLLNEGADLNAKGNVLMRDNDLGFSIFLSNTTALDIAVIHNHKPACVLLIAHGAQANNHHLYTAATKGYIDICELLLAHGIEGNSQNYHGTTALMQAAMHGQLEICKLFIDHHINIHTQDENGGTALQYAACNGNHTICRLLLEHGANPNAVDNQGLPSLFSCYENSWEESLYECLKAHLEYGANPNILSTGKPINPNGPNTGFTLLMHAAFHGELPICELLLQWNADHQFKNVNGESALTQAMRGRIEDDVIEGDDHAGVIELLDNPAKIRAVIMRGPKLQKFSRRFGPNICQALERRKLGKK